MARSTADVIEDAEFLDGTGVGAIDAARRLGFQSTLAFEKWLERKDRYDLWLRMKNRDPEGWHYQAKKGLVAVNDTVDTIAHLIQQGRDSRKARIRNKADRVGVLVDELREAIAADSEAEKQREKARADVARLEKQLAEAKARLRGDATVATSGPSAAEIRAWAAENDMACPAMGRVPADVREAFEAAQEGDAA